MRISISGIDGSGKSSYARLLQDDFKLQGINIKYKWSRKHFFSLPFFAFCRILRITKISKNEFGYTVSEYPFYNYPQLKILFPIIKFIDFIIYNILLESFINFFSKKSIIYDRYSIDTYVDIIDAVKTTIFPSFFENFFLKIFLTDVIVIILDVDEKVSFQRKKDIPNIKYIIRRRNIYVNLAKKYSWKLINTNIPRKDVYKEIKKIIKKNQCDYFVK